MVNGGGGGSSAGGPAAPYAKFTKGHMNVGISAPKISALSRCRFSRKPLMWPVVASPPCVGVRSRGCIEDCSEEVGVVNVTLQVSAACKHHE